jgi:hypothetical protein
MRDVYPDCLQASYNEDSVWNLKNKRSGTVGSSRTGRVCFRRLEREVASNLCVGNGEENQEAPGRAAIAQIAKHYEKWMK